MKLSYARLLFGSITLVLLIGTGIQLHAQPPPRANTFTQISGSLYRGSNGIWHSLVYVTDEGILLVDTLNPGYAAWLKDELAMRFPGKAVKYVIYTHSHYDHAEGGKVFADTATFIAQANMRVNMDGRYPHMPGDILDRNNNGMFEPEEFRIPWDAAPGVCGATFQQARDTNQDGHMTPAEYFAEVVPPGVVYEDNMQLAFGGQPILLMHPGRNHADDMTVVLFQNEGVLFSADFIADALVRDTMLSLPSACGPFDGHALQAWIDGYKAVEALDFSILTTGHGTPLAFSKSDLVETRKYYEYLQQVVGDALKQGMSLAQMKATLLLEPYKGWAQYERLREKNIEAAYYNLLEFSL